MGDARAMMWSNLQHAINRRSDPDALHPVIPAYARLLRDGLVTNEIRLGDLELVPGATRPLGPGWALAPEGPCWWRCVKAPADEDR